MINLTTYRGDATEIILFLYLILIIYMTVTFYAATVAIVYIGSIYSLTFSLQQDQISAEFLCLLDLRSI